MNPLRRRTTDRHINFSAKMSTRDFLVLLSLLVGGGNAYWCFHHGQQINAIQQTLRDDKVKTQTTSQDTTKKLYEVNILAKHGEYDYDIDVGGEGYKVKFCQDSPTDFYTNERLEWIVYDQRRGCKSLHGSNLGYKEHKEETP